MENKLDYISVKDLKRGDYTYNEIDTDEVPLDMFQYLKRLPKKASLLKLLQLAVRCQKAMRMITMPCIIIQKA